MSHKFKAVIFDMDGLLVDSETVWAQVETEMIEERGHRYTAAEREQLVGLRLDEFSEKVLALYPFEETPTEFRVELTERMLQRIPLVVKDHPGAAELIAYIAEQGIPTAIASSSPISIIDTTVESQGWGEVFKLRVSADTVGRGKPAPDVYLKTADLMGIDPADCLALEDSPNGARAAVAAGMTCFAIPDRSHSDHHAFDGITPHVLNSLYDVLECLREGVENN
ncbi:MAG: HAD family phosphatase [Anaerolineae bacterium]|nr:HAD family phosphatase [Anaerolineae bacterium]